MPDHKIDCLLVMRKRKYVNEDGNVNPVMSLQLGIEHAILLLPSSVSEFLKHWLELEWRLAIPQNPQYAFCFEFV